MTAIRKGWIRTVSVLASVVAFLFGVAGIAPPAWAKATRGGPQHSGERLGAPSFDAARATDRFRTQLVEEQARLEVAAADAAQPAQARRAIEAVEEQPQQARRAKEATEVQPQQARRAKEATEAQPQQARRAKEAVKVQPQQARRALEATQPQQARRAMEATQPQQARRAMEATQPQQARRAKLAPPAEGIEEAVEEVGETQE